MPRASIVISTTIELTPSLPLGWVSQEVMHMLMDGSVAELKIELDLLRHYTLQFYG